MRTLQLRDAIQCEGAHGPAVHTSTAGGSIASLGLPRAERRQPCIPSRNNARVASPWLVSPPRYQHRAPSNMDLRPVVRPLFLRSSYMGSIIALPPAEATPAMLALDSVHLRLPTT